MINVCQISIIHSTSTVIAVMTAFHPNLNKFVSSQVVVARRDTFIGQDLVVAVLKKMLAIVSYIVVYLKKFKHFNNKLIVLGYTNCDYDGSVISESALCENNCDGTQECIFRSIGCYCAEDGYVRNGNGYCVRNETCSSEFLYLILHQSYY